MELDEAITVAEWIFTTTVVHPVGIAVTICANAGPPAPPLYYTTDRERLRTYLSRNDEAQVISSSPLLSPDLDTSTITAYH
jgi:hypothetical protein